MNIGESVSLRLYGAPVSGGGYTFVWKWWDGTVDVTSTPRVTRTVNTGGTLQYSLVQCDDYGRSITYYGSLIVNKAPVVIGAPTITPNDGFFPFTTLLQSVAYDPEHTGGTELNFEWYNAGTLISVGTTTVLSTGTYQNQLQVDGVTANKTLTQKIYDTQSGVTEVNYNIRGSSASGLQGSSSTLSNAVTSSASNLSEIIIGPDAEATFTAFASDPSGGNLQFDWSLSTTNGWAADYTFTDTPSALPTGLFKSQITRSVASETAGTKIAVCTVTNLTTGQTISFNTTVQLVSPTAPTINAISTDAPLINGGYAVAQGGYVHFTAAASDPNNALLTYKWVFTQPAVTLYGKTVMLRPSDYSVFSEVVLEGTDSSGGPATILGNVTVVDRYGQSSTVSLQSFVTTLVWPNTQLSPDTSGTGSTTLVKRYFGLSSQTSLQTADLDSLSTDFASSRNLSRAFNPVDQFVYFIYPATLGTATFTVNGTVSTDWLLTVVSYNSITYNVYRSSATLTGLYQITVS